MNKYIHVRELIFRLSRDMSLRRLCSNSLIASATTTSRNLTSAPGVVRLHVNAFYFSTTARRVTSPTWGLPPPCKKALRVASCVTNIVYFFISLIFLNSVRVIPCSADVVQFKKKRETTTHKNHDFLNCFALGLIVWEIGIGSGTVPHGFKRLMSIVKVTPTKYQTLCQ